MRLVQAHHDNDHGLHRPMQQHREACNICHTVSQHAYVERQDIQWHGGIQDAAALRMRHRVRKYRNCKSVSAMS